MRKWLTILLLSILSTYLGISLLLLNFNTPDQISLTSREFYESSNSSTQSYSPLFLQNVTNPSSFTPNSPKNISSSCIPMTTSFTSKEIEFYFRYNTYGKCKLPTNDIIEVDKNTINVVCEHGNTPQYFIDPGHEQRLGGAKATVSWQTTPQGFSHAEYALVKCGESVRTVVVNRFDPEIEKRVTEVQKKIIEERKTEKFRRLSVLVLVFDSVSRYGAVRNWPKTTRFLQEFPGFNQNYTVYNFQHTAAANIHTKLNMVRVLYGKSLEAHERDTIAFSTFKLKSLFDLQQKALWKYYSKLGYVTLFIHDTVWESLSSVFGKVIDCDHVFVNFWKVAFTVYGYHDSTKNQRCAGDQNSHFFSLNYTLQFYKNYNKNNKFAYIHLNAAHEYTGNIKTIDDDLYEFLPKILNTFDTDKEDFALILMSDHGNSPKSLQFDIRGFVEPRSPMTYMIINKQLEEKISSKEILEHNKDIIFGRYDINLSLKDLAHAPYGGLAELNYTTYKRRYSASDVISVFREKANPLRTCQDLDIEKRYCTCREFEPVELNNGLEIAVIENVLNLIKEAGKELWRDDQKLKDVKEMELSSAEVFDMEDQDYGIRRLYKIKVFVNQRAVVEVVANFCTDHGISKTKNILSGSLHPFLYFKHQEIRYFLQLSTIEQK